MATNIDRFPTNGEEGMPKINKELKLSGIEMELVVEAVSELVDIRALLEHLLKSGVMQLVPAQIGTYQLACVDDRGQHHMACAPGGNMGLLILVLDAIDDLLEQEETRCVLPTEMEDFFRWVLHTYGVFYWHTDSHAMDNLRGMIAADGLWKWRSSFATAEEMYEFVQNPSDDPQLRERLIRHLQSPEACGCGHVKMMLEHRDHYGIPRRLVQEAIRLFFQVLWDLESGHQLVFEMLTGDHKAQAVLQVIYSGGAEEEKVIPRISPSARGMQVFVQYPREEEYIWRSMVRAMARDEELDVVPDDPYSIDQIVAQVVRIAREVTGETIKYLGPEVPIIDVMIRFL